MDFECLVLYDVVGFEWDEGNLYKNEKKHDIKWQEIEEIFFNVPLLINKDLKYSKDECRCYILGKTDENKKLFIVFTKRDKKIRVISARVMNKKERAVYEKHEKNTDI